MSLFNHPLVCLAACSLIAISVAVVVLALEDR